MWEKITDPCNDQEDVYRAVVDMTDRRGEAVKEVRVYFGSQGRGRIRTFDHVTRFAESMFERPFVEYRPDSCGASVLQYGKNNPRCKFINPQTGWGIHEDDAILLADELSDLLPEQKDTISEGFMNIIDL